MRASISSLLSRKLLTIPRLSPSHTSARPLRLLAPINAHITDYQPVLILQCSSDLIDDPALRKSEDHMPRMLIETSDEGRLVWKEGLENDIEDGKWFAVGEVIGHIVDDEEDRDDEEENEWTWRAYLDEDDN